MHLTFQKDFEERTMNFVRPDSGEQAKGFVKNLDVTN